MQLRAERTLPVSLEQSLALIHAVESYPDFVPGVVSVSDVSRIDDGSTRMTDLSLRLGFRQISGVVRVRMQTALIDNTVSLTMLQGPFKAARGLLRFVPISGGVRFAAECEYETPISRFDELIQNRLNVLVDAVAASFLAQAKRRYG